VAFKTTIMGREALTRRLDALVPEANKAAAVAKLEVIQELAKRVAGRAPVGATGEYKASIKGERQADNPDKMPLGGVKSKDPDATALYADYIWKFLEYGTKASPGEAPRRDRRYKTITVLTKGKRAHRATPAQPHVMYTWKAYRKAAKAKISRAISKAVTASVKASSAASRVGESPIR
jgi:hypothetical protein